MRKILLLLFICLFPAIAHAVTPEEILQKVDEIRAPAKTFVFRLKVTVNRNDTDSKAEFLVRVKDARKSLVIYKSPPANKGRVLLFIDNNMWIYIPGTRNPLRISPQQQIMGRVSNADAARVVFSLDYGADSVAEDTLDGQMVLKLSLVAKTTGAAYKSIDLWVENETYQPVKAEFFALSGKLLKTAFYKEYKDILGKKRPTVLEIHDGIRESEVSIMEYSDIRIEDTPDAYYQKTFMDRVE
jgi:outer membrane lipoprotein-sorting protein